MPRKNRFAPPGYWLHISQRGNDRQRVFRSDADRQYFLDLLAARSQERGVRGAAYTLMSNHFHRSPSATKPMQQRLHGAVWQADPASSQRSYRMPSHRIVQASTPLAVS